MKATINIRKSRLLLFSVIVLCVMLEPSYVSSNSATIHTLYTILKLVAAGIVLGIFILKRVRINNFLAGLFIFEMFLVFSTMINVANIYECFRKGFYVVILAMFMKYVVEVDAKQLINALSIVLGAYVHINTFSYFLYPEGLFVSASEGYRNCWFLGYDNLALIFIILAQTIALFRILSRRWSNYIWDVSILISGATFVFLQEIATGILAEAIFATFILLTGNVKVRRLIGKAKLIIAGMFIVFFLLQFFNVRSSDAFSVILLMLGKDLTFSSRTWLWEIAWNNLASHGLLFGRGVHAAVEYIDEFKRVWTSHLHCYYLHTLYEGGIISFMALFFWLFNTARHFDTNKHGYSAMALLGGILAILLMWQVEAYSTITIYFVISLFLVDNAHLFEVSCQQYPLLKRRSRKCKV